MTDERANEPRRVTRWTKEWTCFCYAPDEVFCDQWADVPEVLQGVIRDMHGLPCDGGGLPGNWCSACVYGHINLEIEDYEDVRHE